MSFSWPWVLCLSVMVCAASASLFYVLRPNASRGNVSPEKANKLHTSTGHGVSSSRKVVLLNIVVDSDLGDACYGAIHPVWLLMYRLAFGVYFGGVMIVNVAFMKWSAFLFFTQWNFALLVCFFWVGAYYSARVWRARPHPHHPLQGAGLEEGGEVAALPPVGGKEVEEEAGGLGYFLQGAYQVSFPMAILVDLVLWLVLYPEAIRDGTTASVLNFISFNQHGVNLVALVGDFCLNSMSFPLSHAPLVILWATAYVTSQWVLHYTLGTQWSYSFLLPDIPTAPLWYVGLLLIILTCYSLCFALHFVKDSCLGHLAKRRARNYAVKERERGALPANII